MKKVITLLVTLSLILGLCVPTYAYDAADELQSRGEELIRLGEQIIRIHSQNPDLSDHSILTGTTNALNVAASLHPQFTIPVAILAVIDGYSGGELTNFETNMLLVKTGHDMVWQGIDMVARAQAMKASKSFTDWLLNPSLGW